MIDLERELIQYMKDHMPVILSRLEELVAIPSVSDDREAVDRALDYMLDLGASMGFRTRAVCGHEVGIIEMGDGPETIGILGHVDVVPPGDPANWESDPFAMEVREGKAFGRGTIDDKGPMLLCLYAMKALADAGLRVPDDVSIIAIDGIEMSNYTVPTLTTLVQPTATLGERAVEILVDVLSGGEDGQHIRLDTTLRPGGTVGRA